MDTHLAHLDEVFKPVRQLVLDLSLAGISIIICSGREDRYKTLSQAWLVQH